MTNFNIGFQNNKSDVLLHLTQWQYWWWFWFSFVWVLYFLIILRTVRRRRLKFYPKLATTMRPHGKWGDLLACIIPLSWCINILINSSFLLKLIEWQNESSLFTVKIRGKQWYWLYRVDFKNFTKIITAPKNVGHGKWVLFTHGNTRQCDDYMSALQFRRQSNWMLKFWAEAARDEELFNLDQPMNLSFYNTIQNGLDRSQRQRENLTRAERANMLYLSRSRREFERLPGNLYTALFDDDHIYKWYGISPHTSFINTRSRRFMGGSDAVEDLRSLCSTARSLGVRDDVGVGDIADHWLLSNLDSLPSTPRSTLKESTNLVFSSNSEESVRFYRKRTGSHDPVIIRPTYVSDSSIDCIKNNTSDALYLNLPTSTAKIEPKPKLYENFLVRKQKRYKLRKAIPPKKITLSRSLIRKVNTSLAKGSPEVEEVLKDVGAKLLINKDRTISMARDGSSPKRKYKMFKVNKKKTDMNNLNVNRRMLRTRRTLIMPAHANLTAVTNSFDVIHSWFIPGLGLKMDCIPGRATHHTFFIDNVGFYYGQCAEVCGRYHHHMPIRICALPFDHFLLWWHHFGARRFLKPVVNKPGDYVDQLKKETAWRTWAKIEYKKKTGIDISRDPKTLRSRHLNAYALRKYTW